MLDIFSQAATEKAIGNVPGRRMRLRDARPLPQILDSLTARRGDPGQRLRHRRYLQRRGDEVTKPLEGRAELRRAEADQQARRLRPAHAGRSGLLTGGDRDQAAHAVADDDQLAVGVRPSSDQPFEQRSQFAAVAADRQTTVVAQVEGRVAQIGPQLATEIDCRDGARCRSARLPGRFVARQAVHEDAHSPASKRQGTGQRIAVQVEHGARVTKRHGDRQTVVGGGEMIAEDAVQRAMHTRRQSARRLARWLLRSPVLDHRCGVKEDATGVVNRLVDAGDDAIVSHLYESRRTGQQGHSPQNGERLGGDRLMHLTHACRRLLHRCLGRMAAAGTRRAADGLGLDRWHRAVSLT